MDAAQKSCLVAMAEGFHTYPSRTRPLSPPAPMVLGPQGPGRVGRRQAKNHCRLTGGGFYFFSSDINTQIKRSHYTAKRVVH